MLIAINRQLINKASKDILKEANGLFENVDVTAQELAALIDQGFAFCAQHKKGWRKSENFTAAGFLAVDIDHGLSLDAALSDPYVQQYACLLYTTPNHKPEAHRFRVVFELESPISDAETLKRALTGLIAKFGADGACKDACRLFFGSKGAEPIVLNGRLPASEVEALLTRADETIVPSSSGSGPRHGISTTIRSRLTIAPNVTVCTAQGATAFLRDLPPRTSIFCPQHIDDRPSAFTLQNRHGVPGLSCSACNATFFIDDGSGVKHSEYLFDYEWNKVLSLSYDQYEAYTDDDGLIDMSEVLGLPVRQWSELRYLPYEESPPELKPVFEAEKPLPGVEMGDTIVGTSFKARANITLVKSPKGTGKTQWLMKLVADAKAADLSVLLIGHRRALVAATAERLGLTSYLNISESEDSSGASTFHPPTRHYAICLDSIDRLNTEFDRYDIVLIDEVEQVFSHLLSATLREHRRSALLRFQFYLKQAEAMYLLDADLNRLTIEVLGDLLDDRRDRTVQLLLNWWKPEERTVYLHEGAKSDALIATLFSSVERGERCFVCSNSKNFINQIEIKLIERIEPRKVLKVTSDNSQNPEIQAIMRDIKTRALDYAVILSSPAIGTGIDITFEDDAPLIDAVYGFFEPRINTHFDIDQQLSRVRNPGQIHVWISSEEYRFETDVLAIRAELLASGQKQRELLSISPDGKPVYDDLYDKIYATVTASERASKNRLRKNFIDLRRSNGWNVEIVDADKEAGKVGKSIRKDGKEALLNERLQSILAAPQITAERFENLRGLELKDKLKDNERPAMRRYEIESFYCEDATLELLVLDDDGRLRESIRTFGLLVSEDETLKSEDRWDREILLPDQKQLLQKKHLLLELFKSAGILRDKAFDPAIEIESAQLEAFARTAQKNKAEIERHFKIPVRGDVYKKPITQLQSILKLVGLRLPKSRTDQSGGKKRYFYRVAADELATVSTWASRRSDPHRRQAWREQREALINAGDPGSRVVD